MLPCARPTAWPLYGGTRITGYGAGMVTSNNRKAAAAAVVGLLVLAALGNALPNDPSMAGQANTPSRPATIGSLSDGMVYVPNGGCMTKRNFNRIGAEIQNMFEDRGVKGAPIMAVLSVYESMWKAGTRPCEDLADDYYLWSRYAHPPTPAASVTSASSVQPASPPSAQVAVPAAVSAGPPLPPAPPTPEPALAKPPPLPSSPQPAKPAPHRPVRH